MLNNIAKVTQLVDGKARMQTRAHLILEPVALQPASHSHRGTSGCQAIRVAWDICDNRDKIEWGRESPCRDPNSVAAVNSLLRLLLCFLSPWVLTAPRSPCSLLYGLLCLTPGTRGIGNSDG